MPTGLTMHWGAAALQQRLALLLPGLQVVVVARIESTNTALLARARGLDCSLAQAPGTGPCLLVAEHQTHGRGRQGKSWQSSAGASLTFSLALPLAPADWSGLSLAVGLALAETLDPMRPGAALRLGIKWPNDLLLMDDPALALPSPAGPPDPPDPPPVGRKLGGILIETVQAGAQRVAVVGVGLNLLPVASAEPSAGLSWGQAHLRELHPAIDAPAVLARVAAPLLMALLAFERDGFAPLRQRFAARDLLLGRAVTTSLPGLAGGIADGVDDSGTLWLRQPGDGADSSGSGQRWPVRSGEISLRLADSDRARPTTAGVQPC